jgi:pimeloyl-ACP methyl ester carboxylesterase
MDRFRTGSIHANGLAFHYLEAGTGPLVLCLHGFPDHARSFRYQLPALAEAGFRAVAPNLRGYSPTETPSDGCFQTAALAQDAIALLDLLSPNEPAVIFGHDWGALAAYGAALLAPQRVRHLVTAAVPYGPRVMEAVVTDYDQTRRSWHMYLFQLPFAEAAVAHNNFAFLNRLWQDWSPGWRVPAEEIAALKETFQQPGVLTAAIDYYRQIFDVSRQRPEHEELQAKIMTAPIPVPTLAFHGERDGCIGVEQYEGMEAHFPRGLRPIILPGAGHFVHQEKPDEVNRALIEYLGEGYDRS